TFTPLPEPTPSPVIAAPATEAPLSATAVEPPTAIPTPTFAAFGITQTIGLSAEGRAITAYRFGFGTRKLVLVGGIHGGYEWNSILLSYQAIDHFL
ncbi:MAG: hypothetical protein KC421_22870, partial [Anaerolineales bacterium]|nr:hypothetical protein [Anaerolineales bacterium]